MITRVESFEIAISQLYTLERTIKSWIRTKRKKIKVNLSTKVAILSKLKELEAKNKEVSEYTEEDKIIIEISKKLLEQPLMKNIYELFVLVNDGENHAISSHIPGFVKYINTKIHEENNDYYFHRRRLELNSILVNICISLERYVSNVLKQAYSEDNDIINVRDKNITFEELCNFGDVENAKTYLIDSYLDELFRKKFDFWFKDVIDIFGKHNLKNFDANILANISEMYQRRNLIVHNDGVVNNHYLKNVPNSRYKIDDTIILDTDYLFDCIKNVKYLIWFILDIFVNRIITTNNDSRFEIMNHYFVSYIDTQCDLVPKLLKKYSDVKYEDDTCKYFAIANYLLYYKFNGGLDDYKSEVEKFNVNHLDDSFKIAKTILLEEPDTISKFEKYIDSLSVDDFFFSLDWPLFKSIKDSKKVNDIINNHLEKILGGKYD